MAMDIADLAFRTGVLEGRVAILWEERMMVRKPDAKIPWLQLAMMATVSAGSLATIIAPDRAPSILGAVASVLKTFAH